MNDELRRKLLTTDPEAMRANLTARIDQAEATIRDRILNRVPPGLLECHVDRIDKMLDGKSADGSVTLDFPIPTILIAGMVIAWRATTMRICASDEVIDQARKWQDEQREVTP